MLCNGVALLVLFGVALSCRSARAQYEGCLSAHEHAQRARRADAYLAARERLLQCAQLDCPSIVRKDCIAWLAEVEASVPSIVFAVTGADGRDLIDVTVRAGERVLTQRADGRALELDPGAYTLRIEAPGYAPAQLTVTVRAAEKMRLVPVRLAANVAPAEVTPGPRTDTLSAAKIPRNTRSRRVAFTLVGLSAASFASFVATAGAGLRLQHELEDSCPEHCPRRQRERGRRLYVAADVTLGVSLASAVAAVWLFVSSARNSQWSVAPASRGLSFQWRTTF